MVMSTEKDVCVLCMEPGHIETDCSLWCCMDCEQVGIEYLECGEDYPCCSWEDYTCTANANDHKDIPDPYNIPEWCPLNLAREDK